MHLSLSIVDRYLIREILVTWLSVMFVLLLVVVSLEIIHFLKWYQRGELTDSTVIPLFFNSLLGFIVLLIPLGLFLGAILAFSRLYMDSEMTAMMASGIGPRQWYRSLLLIAVPVSLLVLVLMLYTRPWVAQQRAEINDEIINTHAINMLAPGQFNADSTGRSVMFIESISEDSTQLFNVFQHFLRDGKRHVDVAEAGRKLFVDNGQYMLFQEGSHYIGSPGEPDYTIIDYEEYGVRIPNFPEHRRQLRVKALDTRTLLDSELLEHKAELDWRISIPVATLIISLMALPLSQTTPRGGRYARLGLAMFVYLVYSNILGMGKTWIARDTIPAMLGTAWVHLLALALLVYLLHRSGMLASLLHTDNHQRQTRE